MAGNNSSTYNSYNMFHLVARLPPNDLENLEWIPNLNYDGFSNDTSFVESGWPCLVIIQNDPVCCLTYHGFFHGTNPRVWWWHPNFGGQDMFFDMFFSPILNLLSESVFAGYTKRLHVEELRKHAAAFNSKQFLGTSDITGLLKTCHLGNPHKKCLYMYIYIYDHY